MKNKEIDEEININNKRILCKHGEFNCLECLSNFILGEYNKE